MAGMVLETNIVSILHAVNDQNKLYKKSLTMTQDKLASSAEQERAKMRAKAGR